MAEKFGNYELLRRLATGGMGEVFLARPASSPGKRVVIKRALPHLAGDAEAERQFFEEARIAAQLSHPHLVRVLELGAVEGRWFIALEYVDGGDLRGWRDHPVPVGVALKVAADAARALDAAHRARDAEGRELKVVHCDVSPHNLLVGRDGKVRLTDFGIASARKGSAGPVATSSQGKVAYLSPEQVAGDALDHRTDQFSLGVVLWELLTGKRLFEGEDDVETLQRVEACVVPSPASLRPQVPEAAARVVATMLERDRAKRFADCGAAAAALEGALASLPAPATHADVAALVAKVAPAAADAGEAPAATAAPAESGVWTSAGKLLRHRVPWVDEASAATLCERLSDAPRALDLIAGVGDRLSSGQLEELMSVRDLRSAIELAWRLLTVAERETLVQLRGLTGSFSVEEAEALVEPLAQQRGFLALDVLEDLVRSRLVTQRGHGPTGSPLFTVDDEVRAFAGAQFAAG